MFADEPRSRGVASEQLEHDIAEAAGDDELAYRKLFKLRNEIRRANVPKHAVPSHELRDPYHWVVEGSTAYRADISDGTHERYNIIVGALSRAIQRGMIEQAEVLDAFATMQSDTEAHHADEELGQL